jgi:hypothetical protein
MDKSAGLPQASLSGEHEITALRSPRKPSSGKSTLQSSRTSADYSLPSVTLPKGGGAIRGMGEKFSVNTATGTGSLTSTERQ